MRIISTSCALLVCLAWLSNAHANPAKSFAHFFSVDEAKIDEVRGYELPKSVSKHGGFTHVIVGRYQTTGEHRQRGAVFMRCNAKECHGSTMTLDVDAEITVWGLVDLNGSGAALEPGPDSWRRAGYLEAPWIGSKKKRVAWPAFVIETRTREVRTGATRFSGEVTGTARRDTLHVVSLKVKRGERPVRVLRGPLVARGISGAGLSTSYRLERGKSKSALDLIATEQRHLDNKSACIRPKPTERRLTLQKGRYEQDSGLDMPGGCR